MVTKALTVSEKLKNKIDIEVIDPRTLVPLDIDTIINSVKKTNNVVIIQEAVRRGGIASDIQSCILEKAFNYLDSPVEIIAGENVVIPYNSILEAESIPSEEKILATILNKYCKGVIP